MLTMMCMAFLDHKRQSMPCRVYRHNRLENRQAGNCRQGEQCIHSHTIGINRARSRNSYCSILCHAPSTNHNVNPCHTHIYTFPADLLAALYSTHLRWAEQRVQLTFADAFHRLCKLITILGDWKVTQTYYQRKKKKEYYKTKWLGDWDVYYNSTSAARRRKQNKRQL